jgi:hypothetical protein
MQIISYPVHYQLVCANSDFSSFSRISCKPKVALLGFKKGTFAMQKRTYAFPMKLFLQSHYDNLV